MPRKTVLVVGKRLSSRLALFVLLALTVPLTCPPGWCQLTPGSMDVHWNEGSPNCAKDPQLPLQVCPDVLGDLSLHTNRRNEREIRQGACRPCRIRLLRLLWSSGRGVA